MRTEENSIGKCNTKLYTNVEEKDGKGKCRKLFSNFGKWNTKKFRIKIQENVCLESWEGGSEDKTLYGQVIKIIFKSKL